MSCVIFFAKETPCSSHRWTWTTHALCGEPHICAGYWTRLSQSERRRSWQPTPFAAAAQQAAAQWPSLPKPPACCCRPSLLCWLRHLTAPWPLPSARRCVGYGPAYRPSTLQEPHCVLCVHAGSSRDSRRHSRAHAWREDHTGSHPEGGRYSWPRSWTSRERSGRRWNAHLCI